MLDARLGRLPAVRSLQSRLAHLLFHAGVTPGRATATALLLGLFAGIGFAADYRFAGFLFLLASAGLDTLDGTIARECAAPTVLGGIFDLCADRVVEVAGLTGIVWDRPALYFPALLLAGSWYINITVFLATGAALPPGGKVIAYPPGLVERTEAIIFFVLLAFSGGLGPLLCYAYTVLEIATALQRFRFASSQLGTT
jgi:phosphatidylglycerophosphate synthase